MVFLQTEKFLHLKKPQDIGLHLVEFCAHRQRCKPKFPPQGADLIEVRFRRFEIYKVATVFISLLYIDFMKREFKTPPVFF